MVCTQLICQSSLDHPHHTLFIILALVNANKDESFSRSRISKSSARQPSPLDLVCISTFSQNIIYLPLLYVDTDKSVHEHLRLGVYDIV